ncbi:TM1812 family CRISPR-associated protein [Cetobacterium sp.]|uniref:TM1812 family CRISPR-associated protein n=1 Tax=Cetobacterium sp. TaxID=2071632 RepID=UPI003EE491E9
MMNGTDDFNPQNARNKKRKKREVDEKIKIKNDLEKISSGIQTGLTIFKEIEENNNIEKELKKELLLNIYQGKVLVLFGAVDLFFHQLIPEKVLSILDNEDLKETTENIQKLKISLKTFFKYLEEEDIVRKQLILSEGIKEEIDYVSYWSLKNIRIILESISNKKDIFLEIAMALNLSKKELEDKIKQYSDKRNKIAHRLDYDFVGKERKKITYDEILEMTKFYEDFLNIILTYV